MKTSRFALPTLGLLAVAGLAQAQVTLFDNGSLVTAAGGGTGAIPGADLSQIAPGVGVFGVGINSAANVLLADDFSVPCGFSWTVSSIKVYAYQTGAVTPVLENGFVQIWDGQPGQPGSVIIAGDNVTDASITPTVFTNTYRMAAGVTNSAARRVQEITLTLAAPIVLGSPTVTKTYWVSYGVSAVSGGAFSPPTAPRPTDNALQSLDLGTTWAALDQDGVAGAPLLAADTSFKVIGTQTGTACPAPAATLLTPGANVFNSATTPLAAGEVKFFRITLASAIGAGSRLDLDTTGSVLTAPTFGPLLLNDTILALYNESGTLIASDDDDGAGLISQISIGTPLEFSTTTALNFDGRDGATLPAGDYYIGICGLGNPTNIVAGFGLSTNSDATGNIVLRARRSDGLTAISGPTLPGLQTFPALVAGSTTNAAVNVAAGVTRWVRFTLPTAIDATAALDIFTEGTVGMTPANDVSLGLYNSTGGLVATDFVNGSDSLALISLGGGFRPRIGTSFNFYAQNGIALPAGDYYLAVRGGDTGIFNASNFNVVNGVAPNSGPVNLSIRYKTDVSADLATAPVVTAATDFGVITEGSATKSVTVGAESVTYFRFEVAADAPLNGLLVIDTEGSILAPANDTAIRLFNADGTSAANNTTTNNGNFDTDAGSNLLSQLTFGDGAAILTSPAGSQRANSRDGTFVAPGAVYYIGVRSGNGGASAATNWNQNANALNSGTLNMRLRYIADSFSLPASEAPTPSFDLAAIGGDQPLTTLVGPEDVTWIKFTYPATATGSDWVDISMDGFGGAGTDTYLGVYDNDGNLVGLNDDTTPANLRSQLSFNAGDGPRPTLLNFAARDGSGGTLTPGTTYWVASTFWGSAAIAFNTTAWDTRITHALSQPNYVTTIRSSFPPVTPACLADIVGGDGNPPGGDGVDGNDFQAFLNAFGAGSALADLVGGDGNPPGGDGADGNDFQAFLNAFGAGC